MAGRSASVLAVIVMLSVPAMVLAEEGDASRAVRPERVAASSDAPVVLVEMPDLGRQAWTVISSPLGAFLLPEHVLLGRDGTTLRGFSDKATTVNVRGLAKQLEAFIRAGGGEPIPVGGVVGIETEDPLPEKPPCVNEERCFSKICIPACEDGGEFLTCGLDCSNCTYIKICG